MPGPRPKSGMPHTLYVDPGECKDGIFPGHSTAESLAVAGDEVTVYVYKLVEAAVIHAPVSVEPKNKIVKE